MSGNGDLGWWLRREHDLGDLISLGDFAQLCERSKGRITHWRDRRDHPAHPTCFPAELTTVGRSGVYSRRALMACSISTMTRPPVSGSHKALSTCPSSVVATAVSAPTPRDQISRQVSGASMLKH